MDEFALDVLADFLREHGRLGLLTAAQSPVEELRELRDGVAQLRAQRGPYVSVSEVLHLIQIGASAAMATAVGDPRADVERATFERALDRAVRAVDETWRREEINVFGQRIVGPDFIRAGGEVARRRRRKR